MNKLTILTIAARLAPRLLQVRRSTWIVLGLGLLVLFGLLVWAALAIIGWLFGQAQGLVGTVSDAAVEPARGVLEQVERVLPVARERLDAHLGDYLPALRGEAEPLRDVSGEDLGPVPRYAGLARTVWQREGARVAVEYAGRASYAAVLDHYVRGFAAQGYAQTVLSANPEAETHEYAKGALRYRVSVARVGRDGVSVRIEAIG